MNFTFGGRIVGGADLRFGIGYEPGNDATIHAWQRRIIVHDLLLDDAKVVHYGLKEELVEFGVGVQRLLEIAQTRLVRRHIQLDEVRHFVVIHVVDYLCLVHFWILLNFLCLLFFCVCCCCYILLFADADVLLKKLWIHLVNMFETTSREIN